MALKLKNKNFILKYLSQQGERIEQALVFRLEAYVAVLQNHAKKNAGYNDVTSNLKGSIGGVVLKDGKPITYKGFDSGNGEGNSEGVSFINSLISNYTKGYTVLVVAGMEYATYVENYHGLNVLKKTELKMQKGLPIILEKLKLKIDKGIT